MHSVMTPLLVQHQSESLDSEERILQAMSPGGASLADSVLHVKLTSVSTIISSNEHLTAQSVQSITKQSWRSQSTCELAVQVRQHQPTHTGSK